MTLTGGSDYTLSTTTISSPSFSKLTNPVDFPVWINYTPTYTGFSANPTPEYARFRLVGSECIMQFSGSGTSDNAAFTLTAPITNGHNVGVDSPVIVIDNGTWQNDAGVAQVVASSATIKVGKTISTITGSAYAGFTASGTKGL